MAKNYIDNLSEETRNARWADYSERHTNKEIKEVRIEVSAGTFGPSLPVSVIAPYHAEFITDVEAGRFMPG